MIADIDKDGSGTIDFEEFLQMMTAKMGERDSKVRIVKSSRMYPAGQHSACPHLCCIPVGGNPQGIQIV